MWKAVHYSLMSIIRRSRSEKIKYSKLRRLEMLKSKYFLEFHDFPPTTNVRGGFESVCPYIMPCIFLTRGSSNNQPKLN